MSCTDVPQLLSEIAALAVRAHDRTEFRSGTLALLHTLIPFDVAFFQSGASTAGPEPVTWGLPPLTERLLARKADTIWSELAGIRAAALGAGGVVEASGLISTDSELGRMWRSERPVNHLCVGALEEGTDGAGDGPCQRALRPQGARAAPALAGGARARRPARQ